jgi:hypothetical protein
MTPDLAYSFGMTRRIHLRFGFPALLVTLSLPHLMWAQSQGCIDTPSSTPAADQQIKINIVGVEFPGENLLPDGIRAKLVNEIRNTTFNVAPGASDSDWVSELDEVGIRGFLRDQGYFKATTETTPLYDHRGATPTELRDRC